MKTLILCIILGLMSNQSEQVVLIHNQRIDFVVLDEMENFYVVSNNLLEKYNKNGMNLFSYSDKTYPDISSVDFNSSLRPVLFYADVPALVVLDNTLSQQGSRINLNDYGLSQVSIFCTSAENHYWFYDEQNIELIRINRQFKSETKSGNLNLILRREIQPIQMQEINDQVYLLDREIGLIVFDRFGTHLKTIVLDSPFWFSIKNGSIYYQNKTGLHSYNEKNFTESKISNEDDSLASWAISNDYLYKVNEFEVERITED